MTADAFGDAESVPSISWKDEQGYDIRPPARYVIQATKPIDPNGTQSRDVDGNNKYYKNKETGQPDLTAPMKDLVLEGMCLEAPEGRKGLEGKKVTVWIPKTKKGDLFQQFAKAQKAAGKVIDTGDIITVQLDAKRKINPSDNYPAKFHTVTMQAGTLPPQDSFGAAGHGDPAGNDEPPF